MKNYKPNKELSGILKEPDVLYQINISRAGLAVQFLKEFVEYSKITFKELASIFQVSERTIQRYQSDTKLPSGPSEKLIALTKLYDTGTEVFGSTDLFRKWLHTSNMALGGSEPMNLLDTHLGFELVQNELGKLAHGVFS